MKLNGPLSYAQQRNKDVRRNCCPLHIFIGNFKDSKAFGDLQDDRHLADYDVVDFGAKISLLWAKENLNKAKLLFDAWDRVQSTEEAKVFLAAVIFGNKWVK